MKTGTAAKRLLCCVLCAAFVFGVMPLTGCVRNYSRRDIEKYVKDRYGISGFKVSSKKVPLYGGDGYRDYLWTVTESDGTEFYVIDDRYYGTEWASNDLTDNRSAIILKRYLDENALSGFETVPDEVPEGWPDMLSFHLLGDYRTRAELNAYIDALDGMAGELPKGIRIPFLLRFDHKFRTIGDYDNSAADYTQMFFSGDTIDREKAEKDYLHTILDMRYEEYLADFTQDEIRALVKDNAYSIAVVRADGTCDFYDDLIMDPFGYGVSFATLYEILGREGIPAEGDKDDFAFTGTDGSVYEFSNYFSDGDWYYYLKDGERVKMEYYFYDHIYYTKIKDFTGIRLADYTDWKKHGGEYIAEAAGQGGEVTASDTTAATATAPEPAPDDLADAARPVPELVIWTGSRQLRASLEDNPSAAALTDALSTGPVSIEMTDYGGFEKVGPLGFELPSDDGRITAVPGDIILYEGDKLTIYYGENTWTFTRVARIDGVTREQLLEALGEGDVTVTLWIEWPE